MLKHFDFVIAALQEMSEINGDIASRARGLLNQVVKGEFICGLHIALSVFKPLESLCQSLQICSQTVGGMKLAVDTVIEFFTSKDVRKVSKIYLLLQLNSFQIEICMK